MTKTIEAFFDGQVFRPDVPLPLEPNTRVRITVETLESIKGQPESFVDTARALNLDGPTDWAENIDSYLYGRETRHEA